MSASAEQFAEQVLRQAETADPKGPVARYDPDGDCLEFLAGPDPFYAERVDARLTVYYSENTGKIIGALVKSWSRLVSRITSHFPAFEIEVRDGPVKLTFLFHLALLSSESVENKMVRIHYRKLIETTEQCRAEVELKDLPPA